MAKLVTKKKRVRLGATIFQATWVVLISFITINMMSSNVALLVERGKMDNLHEKAVEDFERATAEIEAVEVEIVKLKDPEYRKSFIKSTMMYKEGDEQLFVMDKKPTGDVVEPPKTISDELEVVATGDSEVGNDAVAHKGN